MTPTRCFDAELLLSSSRRKLRGLDLLQLADLDRSLPGGGLRGGLAATGGEGEREQRKEKAWIHGRKRRGRGGKAGTAKARERGFSTNLSNL